MESCGGDDEDPLAAALAWGALERRYQGPEVLDACLRRARATYTAAEALEEFAAAAAGGATADEVIPVLFHDGPVLRDAAEARRLYSNLFGAWDEASGRAGLLGPEDPLPTWVVEASWRQTDALADRDRRREWDRYAEHQADVLAFLSARVSDLPHLPDEAFDTVATVAFEMWRAFGRARPDRVRARRLCLEDLDAAWLVVGSGGSAHDPSAEPEPALADFCVEALDIAECEGLADAGALAPALAAVRAAMARAWRDA